MAEGEGLYKKLNKKIELSNFFYKFLKSVNTDNV